MTGREEEEEEKRGTKEEGERRNDEGAREALLDLISRNAELGDVSDFGGQTPPDARRGPRLFFTAL